jgi:hypothetical protein
MSRILGPIDNLEPAEVGYVIELLAAMSTPDEIKEKFINFTEPAKAISFKTIQKIAMKYSKDIAERNKTYLEYVEGNPLAHRRVRMDILERIVKEAMTLRPSHSVRLGDDFEMVMKADFPSALNALKLAAAEMLKLDELRALEKEAGKVTNIDDEEGYESNNGLQRFKS